MPTLRLPFLYHVDVTRPRRREPDRFVVSDHAEFDIPHVGSDEAPVAVTWTQHDVAAKYPEAFKDGRVPRVVARTWEGRSYLPMGDDATPIPATAFEAAAAKPIGRYAIFKNAFSTFRYPSQDGFGYPHQTDREKGCMVGNLDALLERYGAKRNKVGKDDRATSLNAALDVFRRKLLVVDGTVWTAEMVHEPHYVVVDGAHGLEVEVTMAGSPNSYCHPFRADRKDEAVAWARHLAVASGRDPDGVRVTGDAVEFVDPARLCLDDGILIARQLVAYQVREAHLVPPGPVRDRVAEVEEEMAGLANAKDSVPADDALLWASQTVHASAELQRLYDEADVLDGDRSRLRKALARWDAVERDRRPDMVELGAFARGAPDAAMSSFVP